MSDLVKSKCSGMLAITFFLFLCVCTSDVFGSDKIISIAADAWCPYNCDEKSKEPGFMIDVAREVLAPHGYIVTYKNRSWTMAMSDVKSGALDAIVGAGMSEAKDLVLAIEPLGENRTCFYTRSDDPYVYKTGQSLQNRRVGVISGYLYGEAIDKYVATNRADYNLVQLVTGDKPLLQNILKLKARRIDTLIENLVVMDFSMRKFRVDNVRLAGCEEPTPLFIAFSPKRIDAGRLADLMNIGIRELRKKGRIGEILGRYGLKDWKK